MLRMYAYMHSRFVENHLIRILKDGPLISEVVLSHRIEAWRVERAVREWAIFGFGPDRGLARGTRCARAGRRAIFVFGSDSSYEQYIS
jgi:hypothetical protein